MPKNIPRPATVRGLRCWFYTMKRSASMPIGDAAHSETAERAVVEAVEQFGRLDALYYVAGGGGRN
jgi:hypothetical protein